jgi:hypothetical protein
MANNDNDVETAPLFSQIEPNMGLTRPRKVTSPSGEYVGGDRELVFQLPEKMEVAYVNKEGDDTNKITLAVTDPELVSFFKKLDNSIIDSMFSNREWWNPNMTREDIEHKYAKSVAENPKTGQHSLKLRVELPTPERKRKHHTITSVFEVNESARTYRPKLGDDILGDVIPGCRMTAIVRFHSVWITGAGQVYPRYSIVEVLYCPVCVKPYNITDITSIAYVTPTYKMTNGGVMMRASTSPAFKCPPGMLVKFVNDANGATKLAVEINDDAFKAFLGSLDDTNKAALIKNGQLWFKKDVTPTDMERQYSPIVKQKGSYLPLFNVKVYGESSSNPTTVHVEGTDGSTTSVTNRSFEQYDMVDLTVKMTGMCVVGKGSVHPLLVATDIVVRHSSPPTKKTFRFALKDPLEQEKEQQPAAILSQ